MTLFEGLPWKRFFLFGLLSFLCLYAGMFLLYVAWTAFSQPFFFISFYLYPPFAYFFFSWMYFRKVEENDWPSRFLTVFVWLGSMLLLSAALMGPVYGGSWRESLNMEALQNQWLSAAAILVGAFVAHQTKTRVADSVDHMDFIPR